MTTIEQKKDLRKLMFGKRSAIDKQIKEQYDKWICEELEKTITSTNSKTVHAYIPIANEIDITPLLKKLLASGITVVSPKTLPKRQLENRILHSLDHLETGVMGTKHPLAADIYTGPIDFVIVPGLAFDTEKYRLGYGGGYYDTFLSTIPKAHKYGIFYPIQQVPSIPKEPYDIQLDQILVKPFEQIQ